MIKLKLLLGLFLLFLISCSSHPEHIKYESYDIQSIRLDDDAEYHILAIKPNGESIELADADNNLNIYIRYEAISRPRIIYRFTDKNMSEYEYRQLDSFGYPQIIIPIGYKIETFDD